MKDSPQDHQLSPFHAITIARSSAASLPTDSPRPVAPKIKKSTTSGNSSVANDLPAARTKAQLGKKSGRKKTSDATSCNKVEVEKIDGKMVNRSLIKGATEREELENGKIGVEGGMGDGKGDVGLLVSGPTEDKAEASSDVEKSLPEPDRDIVKDRRSASLPVRNSRKASSRRQQQDSSHKITEYFPVRRSSRMTSTELKKQEVTDLEEKISSNKHDGLKVVDITHKGRGVVATRPFTRGQFVVEYAGDLIELGVAKQREKNYSSNQHVGCYMYYFQHRNKNYCVDATRESGLLGRLVNHSRLKPNCATKVVEVNSTPRLILVASRDISVDEELLYDYGDRSKESLEAYPWLAS